MSAMDVDSGASSSSAGATPAAEAGSAAKVAKQHTQTESMPWVEKYRPATLDDLVAHADIIAVLHKLIATNKLPHLLFYGPPGTGKTSTILAAARQMYGAKAFGAMVLELNASDERGIDVVRDQIKEFAGTKRLFSSGVKLVVLDEADAMTQDAQAALRRVVEMCVVACARRARHRICARRARERGGWRTAARREDNAETSGDEGSVVVRVRSPIVDTVGGRASIASSLTVPASWKHTHGRRASLAPPRRGRGRAAAGTQRTRGSA